MNKEYLFLFAILLIFLFTRPLINLLIPPNPSNLVLRLKAKVFRSSFGSTVFFSIVVLYLFLTGSKVYNIYFGLGFLLASTIRLFTMEEKYLTSITVKNDNLSIVYLTQFLKSKTEDYELASIAGVELSKRVWLMDYPETINIRHKDGSQRCLILDKRLLAEAQHLKEVYSAFSNNMKGIEA